MQFGLLGPVQAWDAGQDVPLGTPQHRSVLAALLLEPGRLVSVSRLVQVLWGDDPPPTAVKNVQVSVHRLRRAIAGLPATALVTRSPGYLIEVDCDQVDLHRFRRLVRDSKAAPHPAASQLLAEALTLWRGPALAGTTGWLTRSTASQLEEERLAALEGRLAADLHLGRHADCVAELGGLVATYPLREELLGLLMLALVRCGRQAEAMSAFRAARARLHDELGIEPGPRLQRLHERILRHDSGLMTHRDRPQASGATRVAAATGEWIAAELPHDIGGFVGRGGELAELDALPPAEGDDPGAVSVVACVDGLAGVGKTALVTHWAHRWRDRFPAGTLYLDLRGYDAGQAPLSSGEGLAQLLHGLGMAPHDVPPDVDSRCRLYRTAVASGRRLVVLDNAASAEQVRPLLAGSRACMTIVTSRARLASLVVTTGAHRIGLTPLGTGDASRLLRSMIGADRTDAEPASAMQLAELCGYLPLALRIAAANVATRPGHPLSTLVADLTRNRLSSLQVADDDQIAIRAAFGLSYAKLRPPTAHLFCLLAAAPATDFTVEACAALADVSGADAAGMVEELTIAHLVEQHTTGRYRLHDLVRAYGAERALGVDDRIPGLRRLIGWQLAKAELATAQLKIPRLLVPPAESAATLTAPAPVPFPDDRAAAAWLESERSSLVAAVEFADQHDPTPLGWRLGLELRGYFRLRRHAADWVATATAGLSIAKQLNDDRGQAASWHSRGHASWSLGDYASAMDYFKRALALSSESGWRDGEIGSLSALGAVHHELGQHDDAIAYYQQALVSDGGPIPPQMQIITLGSLGLVYQSVGRLRAAIGCFTQVLALTAPSDEDGSADVVATCLGNLGMAHSDMGELTCARDLLTQALTLYRRVGSRNGEANVLTGLATVSAETGHHDDATYQATLALRISRDTADRRIECDALIAAGIACYRRGEVTGARERLSQAVDISESIGYGRGATPALVWAAAVDLRLANLPGAAATCGRALDLARAASHRLSEAHALTVAARVSLAQGQYDAALQHGRAALAISSELDLRLIKARSLWALSETLYATDDRAAAAPLRRQAAELLEAAGASSTAWN